MADHQMKTAITVCGKCGAEIPADARPGACPACLLETGLGLLAEEAQTSNAEFRGEGRAPKPARMITNFGDYELLEEIGRGGQGVVYRAHRRTQSDRLRPLGHRSAPEAISP